MKAFFRHPAVQRALALTLAGYLKFVYATLRWTREGQEHADGVWARKGETGAIMAFWHMGIPLSPCAWDLSRNPQELHGLISRSADAGSCSMSPSPFWKCATASLSAMRLSASSPAIRQSGIAAATFPACVW